MQMQPLCGRGGWRGGGVWGGILEGEGVYHTLTYLLGVTCGFRFVEGNV